MTRHLQYTRAADPSERLWWEVDPGDGLCWVQIPAALVGG